MLTEQEFETIEIPLQHSQSPRPDKVHIGLVQLSIDHSLEADWTKLIGSSALVFNNRVYYSSIMTPEALNGIAQGITECHRI
jgi:maleate isomerase